MNLFQKECEEIRQQIAKIFFQIIFKYNKYKINGPKKPKTAIQKKTQPPRKKALCPPFPLCRPQILWGIGTADRDGGSWLGLATHKESRPY